MKLDTADLTSAQFDISTIAEGVSFAGSACPDVDFSECSIPLSRLRTAFGDGSTTLPGGKGPDSPDWPAHWPKEELSWKEFQTAWHAWQAEIGFQPDENPQ